MANPTCNEPFEGIRLCQVCGLETESPGLKRCSRMVAESASMRALMLRAAAIAATDATVVLLGESGTGKEVLARALHANSPRRDRPFLAINVAALPAELLESELFGHTRGAFTGAVSATQGLFQAAEGGTLLLDEIAEMPLPLQAKLLRVLQDGEVRPVGDTLARSVDVRILAATHQDLGRALAERRLREDLYYRLKVFKLTVPPLRGRRDDILPLARLFLEHERHPSLRFTASAERALLGYDWPGNVRELGSAMKHGAVLSRGTEIDLAHLPDELSQPRPHEGRTGALGTLAEIEREHLLAVLEATGFRQADAARVLGIGRTTLWRKLRAFGIVEPARKR